MKGKIIGAAWVPGLPFVLSPGKNPKWKELSDAMGAVSTHINELRPDVLVIYSTQWLSVLGTSFQVRPNPKGVHVDENWYEWGDLEFDFKTDPNLGEAFAKNVSGAGLPTKAVNFDEFPIDTGTIVAMNCLNKKNEIPVSIVSSWVYADDIKTEQLAKTMLETIEKSGKKAFVIVSSLLSTRYFTDEISPSQDKISNSEDDAWNRKVLNAFESGNLGASKTMVLQFAKSVPTDMLLKGYYWLTAMMGSEKWSGQVLAYGPQWGTGAVVAEFRP